MKQENINGVTIPYDLPTEQLIENLNTSTDMTLFSAYCTALSFKNDKTAYHALYAYLSDRDYYKRLCAFGAVLQMPYNAELIEKLNEALLGNDLLFISRVLDAYASEKCMIQDEFIRTCFLNNKDNINSFYYSCLQRLSVTQENYSFLLRLFTESKNASNRIALSELLAKRTAEEENCRQLLNLFINDQTDKIRLQAALLAIKFNDEDAMNILINDTNGHIRKLIKCK